MYHICTEPYTYIFVVEYTVSVHTYSYFAKGSQDNLCPPSYLKEHRCVVAIGKDFPFVTISIILKKALEGRFRRKRSRKSFI